MHKISGNREIIGKGCLFVCLFEASFNNQKIPSAGNGLGLVIFAYRMIPGDIYQTQRSC
jgi:hypothetical protein